MFIIYWYLVKFEFWYTNSCLDSKVKICGHAIQEMLNYDILILDW